MEYDQFSAVDFLADETFQNYCAGESGPDLIFWQNYITAHPEKAEEISTAKKLYAQLNAHKRPLSIELEHFRQEFNRRSLSEDKVLSDVYVNEKGVLARYKIVLFSLATVICVFLIWNFYGISEKSGGDKISLANVFETKRAQRKRVTLSDGTSVYLNAESKVSLRKGYNGSTREVDLTGEAYFEVYHNAAVPFIVHTSKMDIKVLGTVFNVHAYQDEDKTEATLISGSIEAILNNKDHQKFILKPAEKISVANASAHPQQTGILEKQVDKVSVGPLILTNKNVVIETAWVNNGLEINNETFSEIRQKLEREYGVVLQFKDEDVMRYKFTATIKNEPITEVLKAMQTVNYFNYKIKDNVIELSR